MGLAILEEPRTFSPKGFFVAVWLLTAAVGAVGLIVAILSGAIYWFWIVVLLIGLRQLWVTRWVQVDTEGIRTRNVFGRGRSLPWEGVGDVDEQTFALRKEKFFGVLKLTGTSDVRRGMTETIQFDSDLQGYDLLKDIVLDQTSIITESS